MTSLCDQNCVSVTNDTPRLDDNRLQAYLVQIPEWMLESNQTTIARVFHFENYYETIAFVNAVAWLAHQQDHHPDMEVSYRWCKIKYSTHRIKALSLNDFICAARIDALLT